MTTSRLQPRLSRCLCLAVLVVVMSLTSGTTSAWSAEILTPEQYADQLRQIDGWLAHGDLAQAIELSASTAQCDVSWPTGTLHADPTIAVLVRSSASAQARLRIAAILASTGSGPSPAVAGTSADAATNLAHLSQIAQQEADAQRQLRNGGSIDGLPHEELPIPVSWQDHMIDALIWVRDRCGDALHWLLDWLFGTSHKEHPADSGQLVMMISFVLVGIILAVVLVMAWRAWQTRSGVVPHLVSAPPALVVDADPRSRAVDEWLAYAQQLMAAGRYREATRAYFHALLVQCWSHGLIHHRIGKTNWEYALLLPASLTWRGQFQELTRSYDCIWYGGRDDREAVEVFASDTKAILGILRQPAAVSV